MLSFMERSNHVYATLLTTNQGLEGEASGEQLPGGQGEQQCNRGHQGSSRAGQICYHRYITTCLDFTIFKY